MRRALAIFGLSLGAAGAAWPADYQFRAADWAVEVDFAAAPKRDVILTASPQGDMTATRYFYEPPGEHYLLIKFVYPMAMMPGEETGVYDRSMTDLTRSRPGQVRVRELYHLGPYEGQRVVLGQPREKSTREVRLIVIGSSLYVLSAEWPDGNPAAAAHATAFLGSLALRSDYADQRVVEERERFRELGAGRFKLRYDATRWYRDPADQETGVFNFLRTDQKAEAQFICEDHPIEDGDIDKAVLATAREGAETVTVKKQGKKLRGAVTVSELEFAARVDNVLYLNHGYFYTGPEGAVQLRGWAKEPDYRDVAGDITELLDGLQISAK